MSSTLIRDVDEIQEISPEKHVLHLADMWLGSTIPKDNTFTVCRLINNKPVFEHNVNIFISEAVENIIREVLINARDAINEGKDSGSKDNEITINITKDSFTSRNGGKILPVQKRAVLREGVEYEVYVPTSTFFRMFSGSNYSKNINTTDITVDDSNNKTNTGRNGVGSKLANIFSVKFEAQVFDKNTFFKQVSYDNMSRIDDPEVRKATIEEKKNIKPFVQVSFIPDFDKLKIKEFTNDIIDLIRYHCYCIAYNSQIKIIINDHIIEPINIYEYASLEFPEIDPSSFIIGYTWPDDVLYKNTKIDQGSIQVSTKKGQHPYLEYLIIVTPENAKVVSFVNGNLTRDGGKHVDCIYKATKYLLDEVNNTVKSNKINISYLKTHLHIIVNAYVKGTPHFNGNVKTLLKEGKFKCELSDKNKKILNSSNLKTYLEQELQYHVLKTFDNEKGLSKGALPLKLEDAKLAKKKKSQRDDKPCYLVLTEGDSALKLAKIYFNDDRDHYGLFPLRGKILNIKKLKYKNNASDAQKLLNNEECISIKRALGLQFDTNYSIDSNRDSLRYDGILIASDQDVDGAHIKGLCYSFIRTLWPELTERSDFLIDLFITPLLAAPLGKKRIPFYNKAEYDAWCKEDIKNEKAKPKYYKGLASFSKNEIILDKKAHNYKQIRVLVDEDTDKELDIAFSGDKYYLNLKKEQIMNYDPSYVVKLGKTINASYLAKYIVVEHSYATVVRAIVAMDGFKEASRKMASTALIRYSKGNFKDPIRTDAFMGKIVAKTEYHHGPGSLAKTIDKHTQGYPGTCNNPFLLADALFGDRDGLKMGSERYTFVMPQKTWNMQFKNIDLRITPRIIGEKVNYIEYKYIPQVLPQLLLTFNRGIACGFVSFIPGCKDSDLKQFYIDKITDKTPQDLIPWARGFKGILKMVKTSSLNKIDKKISEDVEISEDEEIEELPNNDKIDEDTISKGDSSSVYSIVIKGKWQLLDDNSIKVTEIPIQYTFSKYKQILHKMKENGIISDFSDDGTDENPCFIINGMNNPSDIKLHLRTVINLSNMRILSDDHKLIKFDSLTEIANAFYDWNLPHYEYRRNTLISELTETVKSVENKADFIKLINDGIINIERRSKEDLLLDAEKHGIERKYIIQGFSIWSITKEKEDELRDELNKYKIELDKLLKCKAKDLWLEDLIDWN